MCTQTETREECCCCGNTTSTLVTENCALRLQQQAFQSRPDKMTSGGRCYGVATTSNTIVVTCPSCADMQRGGKHEGNHHAAEFGGFARRV